MILALSADRRSARLRERRPHRARQPRSPVRALQPERSSSASPSRCCAARGAALWLGDAASRVGAWVAHLLRRTPPQWSGEALVRVRAERLTHLRRRWPALTAATLGNQLTAYLIFEFSLRAVGVSVREPAAERGVPRLGDRARAQLPAAHAGRNRSRRARDDRDARRLRRPARARRRRRPPLPRARSSSRRSSSEVSRCSGSASGAARLRAARHGAERLGQRLDDFLARVVTRQPLPHRRDDPLEPAKDERATPLGLEPPPRPGEAPVDVAKRCERSLGIEPAKRGLERAVVEHRVRVVDRHAGQRFEHRLGAYRALPRAPMGARRTRSPHAPDRATAASASCRRPPPRCGAP